MRLKLEDHGFPYMKIMRGKQWIGRTYKDANGRYVCIIEKQVRHVNAASHEEAFREGGARWLGHKSAGALAAANDAARQSREANKAAVNALVRVYNQASTPEQRSAAFDAVFDRIMKE